MKARAVGLPIAPPFAPMEAQQVAEIPRGDEWQYEPKWDGFRALAFRSGEDVELQSKSGQPLARYFPEIVDALRALPADRFVIDGELVVPEGDALSFDELLQRIHPAESRVRRLAREHPANFIVYDMLVDERGASLIAEPLTARRALLERFARAFGDETIRLSPVSTDLETVQSWFDRAAGTLDGVIAKRRDEPYRSGERSAVVKIKHMRTADCVVGGFRYSAGGSSVGSLLLGLYDAGGKLNHVGFTSGFSAAEKRNLVKTLQPLIAPPGFTGRAPGGPSRWSHGRNEVWHPLKAVLVLEVAYDHVSGGRFRHGTRPVRWRPDKAPKDCRCDQLAVPDLTWKVMKPTNASRG